MVSRTFHVAALLLALYCLSHCTALKTPDLPDLAVEVIPHLTSALEVQLSASELSRWNVNVTEQQLICIEETVKDELTKSDLVEECSRELRALGKSGDHADRRSTNNVDAQLIMGSGDDDDEDSGSGLPPSILSTGFCSKACQSVFIPAYKACEIPFFDDTAVQVRTVLVDLCRINSNDEICLDVVSRFPPSPNCTPENGCPPGSCKLAMEYVSNDLGCCLRHNEGSQVSKLLSNCGLLNQGCVTASATVTTSSTAIFVISVWVILLII